MDSGGGYTVANTVPACGPCNRMKGAMPASEWVARCALVVACHGEGAGEIPEAASFDDGRQVQSRRMQQSLFPLRSPGASE